MEMKKSCNCGVLTPRKSLMSYMKRKRYSACTNTLVLLYKTQSIEKYFLIPNKGNTDKINYLFHTADALKTQVVYLFLQMSKCVITPSTHPTNTANKLFPPA